MKVLIILFTIFTFSYTSNAQTDRDIWVKELVKMADPILSNLSNNQLKEKMPVEQADSKSTDRALFVHLEGFGRLMAGIAPWLELGVDNTIEGQLRKKYLDYSHKAIYNAVNPESEDYMNFSKGKQPLVDAAFLAQAFLRAPEQLWNNLPKTTKQLVIDAFKKTFTISDIPYSNWLLFSGTIEAFLIKNSDYNDFTRIEFALRKHFEWYVGDGLYSDGKYYHWDYYNSFVIHPMLLDILDVLKTTNHRLKSMSDVTLKRAQRYGIILERQISPEGTFPVVGRSSIYRFGAFQVLAQLALMEKLPKELSNGQVRAGLTAVMKRLHQAKGTYDDNGWLKIGVVGSQPKMAESYICTGSLYLTSLGFLPLGLPSNHPFWTSEPKEWTMVKIWGGNPSVKKDHYTN
ncbi:DUF2264 domain-containing protein [Polaribacter haliotis]|uniref:DUF2264 domain-containing protein n=1 Tax=Polaribacter haliotis TaxID=1888915 RepID=A0A7L8AFE9_9FLAO|nr:DUF2264 domain-containing protein [Polaribacter haliotis]QOD60690.1 DUF2264 domain-containing protein [Polaribacter haliotis]